MAARWFLFLALLVVALAAPQARAHVQPAPFGSYFALTANKTSGTSTGRRATRALADASVRLVHGSDASRGQFPHQAGIYVDMAAFCGGALIAPKWILTAASCAGKGPHRARYTAFLGAQDINLPAEKGRLVVTTTWAHVHEDYDAVVYRNDVALLLLPREVQTTEYIKPASLPPKSYANQTFDGSSFQLSGWGYRSDSSASISPRLQFIDLKGVSKKVCVNTYGFEIYNEDMLCCVGDKQSPCQGDTGSALVQGAPDSSYTHIAVASFTPGKGCSIGLPAGFTRTASFLDWIAHKTGLAIKQK